VTRGPSEKVKEKAQLRQPVSKNRKREETTKPAGTSHQKNWRNIMRNRRKEKGEEGESRMKHEQSKRRDEQLPEDHSLTVCERKKQGLCENLPLHDG